LGTKKIVCTPEHPFYVDNNWVEAKDLKEGDKLTIIDGSFSIITELKKYKKEVKTYNFEVAINHNYYVSELGVLVHNDCGTGWMKKDLYNKIGKISKEFNNIAEMM